MELVWNGSSSTKNQEILNTGNSIDGNLQVWLLHQKIVKKLTWVIFIKPNFLTHFRHLDLDKPYQQLEENLFDIKKISSIKMPKYHTNCKSYEHSWKLFITVAFFNLLCHDWDKVFRFITPANAWIILWNYKLHDNSD
jgi:hypothetical protein